MLRGNNIDILLLMAMLVSKLLNPGKYKLDPLKFVLICVLRLLSFSSLLSVYPNLLRTLPISTYTHLLDFKVHLFTRFFRIFVG